MVKRLTKAGPQRGKLVDAGTKAERKMALRTRGRATIGSGGAGRGKGDVYYEEFLAECKSTVKDSLSVKLDWLAKITQEALDVGKYPCFSFLFTDKDGNPRRDGKWVAVPEHVFNKMREVYEEHENGDE